MQIKYFGGLSQEYATLIQSSTMLRALIKKGIITKEEVEVEVPSVIEEIKQALMLVQMKVPNEKK